MPTNSTAKRCAGTAIGLSNSPTPSTQAGPSPRKNGTSAPSLTASGSSWARVQFNDVHGHSLKAPDPAFQCMPDGVPRIGLPQEIVQTDKHMLFIYPLHIRRIYIDGREHPPEDQWLGTWFGHSVGTWEGDTLVVSTVDFNGLEWLGWPGWITSPDKRVIERIRRVGNALTWEAEVTDSILMQPWKTGPLTRVVNSDPRAEIEEPLPCVERDLQHIVTRERG